MSLYDKASLVLIPSGYKAGTTDNLYSVLPANGDGDFNATRGSSATRVNKDGLIESVVANTPRLDYPLIDGVVQDCPALLLEPTRRNLATDSNLSLLLGGSSGSIATTGDGASADVTLSNGLTGKRLTVDSSGRAYLNISCTVVSGTEYTISIYAENYSGADQSNFIDILSGGGGEDFSSSLIENGRIQGTFTASSTSVVIRIGHGTTSTRTGSYSVDISGVQLEDSGSGSDATYATSLIHTSGSIVTRNADLCIDAGNSNVFNDSEGVLYAEIAALANDLSERRITLSEGGYTNRLVIAFDSGSAASNRLKVAVASSTLSFTSKLYVVDDITEFNKIALRWDSDGFDFYVNGSQRGSHGTSPNFTNDILDDLSFTNAAGSQQFYGKVKQVMVFNEALTDAELATLTS